MTGAEIVTEIKRHTNNRTSAVFNDSWYTARMNAAYQRFATFRDPQERRPLRFPQFFDRMARDIAADPADNFVENQPGVYAVIALWNTTDNRRIRRKSNRSLLVRNPLDSGPIIQWAPFGQTAKAGYLIWKRPVIQTTVLESVYKYPETLTNSSTKPVIDDDYHEAIHLIGGGLAADLMDMPDKAAQLQAMALDFIRSHRVPDSETRSGGGRAIYVMQRTS